MARYRILFRRSVAKDLRDIPKKDVQRILRAIEGLAGNPCPPQSAKLSGDDKYRLRCGVYRVLYEIEDDQLVVYVVRVRHRREAYRD